MRRERRRESSPFREESTSPTAQLEKKNLRIENETVLNNEAEFRIT